MMTLPFEFGECAHINDDILRFKSYCVDKQTDTSTNPQTDDTENKTTFATLALHGWQQVTTPRFTRSTLWIYQL